MRAHGPLVGSQRPDRRLHSRFGFERTRGDERTQPRPQSSYPCRHFGAKFLTSSHVEIRAAPASLRIDTRAARDPEFAENTAPGKRRSEASHSEKVTAIPSHNRPSRVLPLVASQHHRALRPGGPGSKPSLTYETTKSCQRRAPLAASIPKANRSRFGFPCRSAARVGRTRPGVAE